MDVRWVSQAGIEDRPVADLEELLARPDGFVWVDVPVPDVATAEVLQDVFGFHPLAVQACLRRSHVPKVHAYPDHLFLVLHVAEPGEGGHVHLLELDEFMGPRYLVTVHGPLGEGVPLEEALKETRAVAQRIRSGRFLPTTPAELSHAIVSFMARRLEALVATLATKVATLERRVVKDDVKDPEQTLEELFLVRHELLTLRTLSAQGREIYARISSLGRFVPPEASPLVQDLMDQFERLRSLAGEEMEFLQGIVDFYQSRTATKMNIAMERLALIAALLLPVTAIASIYGMNIIVSSATRPFQLGGVLVLMVVVTAVMLRWSKRHGWW